MHYAKLTQLINRTSLKFAPSLKTTLTFLGTSTSVGIPVIGCDCATCTSVDTVNHRLRSSIHIQTPTHSILVDSGPDLRQQALRHHLFQVDAVLYTHSHLDHVSGFDELRAFCWSRDTPLPLYARPSCIEELKKMFGWAFDPANVYKGYVKPDPHPVEGVFMLGETKITPLPVIHGHVETIGYRFDTPCNSSYAYIPDAKIVPPATRELLHGVDNLIIDALRPDPHPTHLSIQESLVIAEEIQASKVWLTHISHETDVHTVEKLLPSHVRFAYDTLVLS